jgi:hypothetical protein
MTTESKRDDSVIAGDELAPLLDSIAGTTLCLTTELKGCSLHDANNCRSGASFMTAMSRFSHRRKWSAFAIAEATRSDSVAALIDLSFDNKLPSCATTV